MTLVIEILFSLYTNTISKSADVTLLIYGGELYSLLTRIYNLVQAIYDKNDTDPVNKDFLMKFEATINFLAPVNILNENKEISFLVTRLNECCFSNIQKYNLNEKPINEDLIKDDNIKEYVKGLKLNVLKHRNKDVGYLDQIQNKHALINELFVAVKLINLSVITFVNYLTNPLAFFVFFTFLL